MEAYLSHLHQLPNFLQSEVTAHAGSTHELSIAQIVSNYRRAAEQLIAAKRASFRPVNPAIDFYAGRQSSREQLDKMVTSRARKSPFELLRNPSNNATVAHITLESIRYLTIFNNQLAAIQAQLNEAARQLALRRAEEAARQLAKRQAEEAARQLAQRRAEQEAARLRAQQQAAQEAARQLAQRQAEEAAKQLALQQAKEAAVRLIRPRAEQAALKQILERAQENAAAYSNQSASPIRLIPGPKALDEIKNAAKRLKKELQTAIADFSAVTSQDKNIPVSDAFSAMLYAFKQTGVDVQKSVAG